MAEFRASLQSVTDFFNAKLSQRIVYWVFLSIVVIEVIIFGAFGTAAGARTLRVSARSIYGSICRAAGGGKT